MHITKDEKCIIYNYNQFITSVYGQFKISCTTILGST